MGRVRQFDFTEKKIINILTNQGGTFGEIVYDEQYEMSEIIPIGSNCFGKVVEIQKYSDNTCLVVFEILAKIILERL